MLSSSWYIRLGSRFQAVIHKPWVMHGLSSVFFCTIDLPCQASLQVVFSKVMWMVALTFEGQTWWEEFLSSYLLSPNSCSVKMIYVYEMPCLFPITLFCLPSPTISYSNLLCSPTERCHLPRQGESSMASHFNKLATVFTLPGPVFTLPGPGGRVF